VREIKFRALVKETGRWQFGSMSENSLGLFFVLLENNILNGETLGQYTGLKDKNGEEIWEGDTVKVICSCGHSENLPVKSKDGYNGFYLETKYQHDWDNSQLSLHNSEVIGNIYEGLYSGEKGG